jgi:quercetin dioxygenase-like cupin family protein
MTTNPTPYALGSEDGEAFWFFGMLATMKATAEQTGGVFILVEQLAPRGTATPLHVHPQDDESFYILEGECTFYLEDGQPIPASAGSFVHIPKGYVPHAFQVDSETALLLSRRRHGPFRRKHRSIWRGSWLQRNSMGWRYSVHRRVLILKKRKSARVLTHTSV